jgi:hypothetical protein
MSNVSVTISRKEIALLLDLLRCLDDVDTDTKEQYGLNDIVRIRVMRFKLWRTLRAASGDSILF